MNSDNLQNNKEAEIPVKNNVTSKYNATKHGVLTKILTETENEEVQVALTDLSKQYQATNFTEKFHLENAAIWYVRLQRAIKAEQEYLLEKSKPPVYEQRVIREGIKIIDITTSESELVLIDPGYKAEISMESIESVSGVYLRYITTCERNLNRSLHELERIQLTKSGQRVPPPMTIDVSIDRKEDD